MKVKRFFVFMITITFLMGGSMWARGTSEENTENQTTFLQLDDTVDRNISMELTFLTHKQGMEDDFARYQGEFNEIYPNVKIIYEPIGSYKKNIEIRWTSNDWGDLCMIPPQFITESELPNLFAPLATVDDYADKYEFASAFAYEETAFGITSTGTAYGVLWNKAVLEKAGVTSFPKTPEEFYLTLEKVKQNTDAIPLYVNYGAGSRLADWEWNARGSLTADSDYKNKLIYMVDPFSPGKPYNTVMKMLYNVVQMGLVEDDPSTSTWDTCKNLLAFGKVACTVIGSWATVNTQDEAENPEDIVFTAFPWNIQGEQYATIAADYAYAINKNVSAEKYIVAKNYIEWLTEKSNFSFDAGGIPIAKDQEYPQTLKNLQDSGVTLVPDNPPHPSDTGLFIELNSESELYLGKYPEKARIVEAAMGQSDESFESIMEDWNKRWTLVQTDILGSDYPSKNSY